jgi:hypothetical protein
MAAAFQLIHKLINNLKATAPSVFRLVSASYRVFQPKCLRVLQSQAVYE